MTLQIALLLTIMAVGMVLFSLERFPADVVALGLLSALVLTGLLPPARAFAEFTSDAAIMVFGLLVFTAALVRSGAVDIAARTAFRFASDHPERLLAVITMGAAALSSVMSNTATAALFVPITFGLARRARVSASKLLMPLAFATILASSVTLIASSTNIVISGLMSDYDMRPLGMFELTLVGVPILIAGLVYLLTVGHRLVPDRGEPESADTFGVHSYLVEAVILPGSRLQGLTLAESRLGHDLDLTVVRVLREGNRYLAPRAGLRLQEQDTLLLKGRRDEILKIGESMGVAVKGDIELSDPRLQDGEVRMAEAILLPPSPLVGQSLAQTDFRQRYGVQVLGISRRGADIFRKLSQVPLRTGDQLLVQGSQVDIAMLDRDNILYVLGSVERVRPDRSRALIAAAIFGTVLVVIALGLLPLSVAVLLGVLGVFVTRCIAPDRAYREIEWKTLVVIGSMLALGSAMQYTGTAQYLAGRIAALTQGMPPLGLLSAFFALALLLTQPMSNQAAAVVVVPVALQTALRLGLNPRTFAVMIAVGASCSFITPLEPACLMVYGPGRYRFLDFAKVGAALTLLVYGIAILLVPWIWPL